MTFTLQYDKFITEEKSVSKTLIRSKNFYRINSYKYADGVKKTLSGKDSGLVFAFGRNQQTLFCVKLNEIKPEKFFGWLKNVTIKNIDFDKIEKFEECVIKSDREGKGIFNLVKRADFYNQEPSPYRTYTIQNIGNIEEITFDKEILKKYI
jgi:hypothetical protein